MGRSARYTTARASRLHRASRNVSMGASEEKMEAESNVRRWAEWLLGAAVALQFYFVQELLAALALFAIGFAGVASVIVGLYGLQKGLAEGGPAYLRLRPSGGANFAGQGFPAECASSKTV